MESRFILCELFLVACILLNVSATDQLDCEDSNGHETCSITITPSTENFYLRLYQGARTIRCISCEIQTLQILYVGDQIAGLLRTMDYSKSHIKTVELHKYWFPHSALILFNVSHNEISYLNDTSLFSGAQKLLTIDLSHNRINSLSKNVFNRFVTLQTVNLSFNAIEELDESIFSDLKDLKILKINNNNLTSLRNLFDKTVSLEQLDVSFNNIECIETTIFQQTKILQSLKLNDNRLSCVLYLQHLEALIILDLSNNALTTLDPSTFTKMTQLQVLRLTNNKLQEINLKLLLARTPILSHLYVNQNRLKELHLSFATKLHTMHAAENNITLAIFITMPSLEVLDLSRNNLSNLVLIDLLSLRQLKADHNNLSSIAKISAALPAKLSSLNLAYNHLDDINATTFARFEDLQFLSLQQSGLNRIDENTLSGLKNIRTLDISYNKLKDFDMMYLWNQRELTELYLDGNGLSSTKNMNFSFITLPNLKRIGILHNDWLCTDLWQLVEPFILKGIKIDRPPVGWYDSYIGCTTDKYTSTSEVTVVEGATYATNHEDYLNGIENIDKLTNDDVERINRQFSEEFRKHIINEAKEIHQRSRIYIAVAFCLVCIAFVMLLIGIVLLYNRNRTERTLKLSDLQDL